MDFLSNKAIMIGVSLFVTMSIVSGVMLVVTQIQGIYKGVYKTNISISRMFSEYDAFDDAQKTGVDLLNAAKRYKDNRKVNVYLGGTLINNDAGISNLTTQLSSNTGTIRYETKYRTTVTYNTNDTVSITFR